MHPHASQAIARLINANFTKVPAETLQINRSTMVEFILGLWNDPALQQPFDLHFGHGKIGVHGGNSACNVTNEDGSISQVPALSFTRLGTGKIGEATDHPNMTPPNARDWLGSLVFHNIESLDVVMGELQSLRDVMSAKK